VLFTHTVTKCSFCLLMEVPVVLSNNKRRARTKTNAARILFSWAI